MSFGSAMGEGDGASAPTPYPTAELVEQFHTNSDVNSRREAQHHTLGVGEFQASPGPHTHRGGDSVPLLTGVTLSGSRGGNVALLSVIQALVALGATDSTTP
jgi:hypothetical protein